jgi:hypothetical protein
MKLGLHEMYLLEGRGGGWNGHAVSRPVGCYDFGPIASIVFVSCLFIELDVLTIRACWIQLQQ